MESWTWGQLSLLAECIEDVAAERADMVAVPVVRAAGVAAWKGHAEARRKARRRRDRAEAVSRLDPAARDEARLAALRRAGIGIREAVAPPGEPVPGDPGDAGGD